MTTKAKNSRLKVLLYGSLPVVQGGASYFKYITSVGGSEDKFVTMLKKIFDVEVFSWTKRICFKSIKHVYLVDGIRILYHLFRRAVSCDLIITLGYPALFEFTLLLFVSKLRRIPIIVRETHWYWPQTRISRFLWYVYFKLMRHVDGIICPGKASYKYWKGKGFSNVFIVHYYTLEASMTKCNNIKLKKIKEKYMIPDDALKILYLGRLIKKKGVDLIIKSFASLIKEVKDARLVLIIAGDGEERNNLIYLTRKLGISNNVRFTGPVKEDEKECFYKLADVFVYVPRIVEIPEEWPIAPLEALSLKIPTIVSTAVGSLPEIIPAVIVVKEGDENYLKNAMKKLIYNSKLRSMLSNNAVKVCKKLNIDNVYKELLKSLLEIVKSKHTFQSDKYVNIYAIND